MSTNSFGTRDQLVVDDTSYSIHRLARVTGAARLPYSLKVLLENLLRNEDGRLVSAEQVSALAAWSSSGPSSEEVAFTPARVLMQDFTGVPCVVDLVAMRDAIAVVIAAITSCTNTSNLTGEESIGITGVTALADTIPDTLHVRAGNVELDAWLRIDTPTEAEYYRHGGILPYVLRQLLAGQRS